MDDAQDTGDAAHAGEDIAMSSSAAAASSHPAPAAAAPAASSSAAAPSAVKHAGELELESPYVEKYRPQLVRHRAPRRVCCGGSGEPRLASRAECKQERARPPSPIPSPSRSCAMSSGTTTPSCA